VAEKVGEIYYDVTLDTGKMIGETRVVNRELDGLKSKFTQVASAVSLLAVAMAAVKAAKLADDMRMLGARVQVASGSIEAGASAMAELEAISRRTQTSIEANAEVFTRLNAAMKSMGGTQADTLRLTETLGMAIKVSGASAVEAKAAMLQFGQALGSGKLAGDELRSLMETAPYLMRQMADAMGVPVGSLKQLGEQGKLTADVVASAMQKAASQIERDFEKFPQTFDAATTVMSDAAARANAKLDELTGTSAALAGATKGLGEVLNELAKQFGAANEQAGIIGRNSAIKDWSDSTKIALSYVIDAADLAWQTLSVLGRNVAFVFQGVRSEIGGIAAQAASVARGDFEGARAIGEAMKADAEKRRADLDAADAKALGRAMLAGQAMRKAWEQGAGGGRGTINPSGEASKLSAPAGSGSKKASTFDQAAYIADLRKAQASEINVINETETEKLRIAKKHLDERKIDQKTYSEAVKLITQTAERDRADLMLKTQEQIDKDREQSDKKALDDRHKHAQDMQKAMEYGAQLTKAINPIDALRQEYQAKLDLVTQYEQMMALAGVNAEEQGQMARMQITNEYELQRRALAEQSYRSQGEAQAFMVDSLNALSSTATQSITGLINGTMTAQDAMRALAGTVLNEAVGALVQIGIQQIKNALISDTIAAADTARKAANGAVYAASVSAQVAGMSSMAAMNAFAATAAIPIVGPALAPAAAAAAGAAAAAMGAPAVATAPVAGARRYGGPVSADSLYRVNESGRPEMFTASNGTQYMMPTSNGTVTPADKVGSGGAVLQVQVINNHSGAQVQTSMDQSGQIARIVISEVAGQIRENSGPVWSALRSSTNVQGRL